MIIQAVIFDADGVIVNPMMQFARYLEREHKITPAMTRPFFSGPFEDCLLGKRHVEEVLPAFLPGWGWKGSVEQFVRTWMIEDDHVDPQLIAIIQELRRSGLRCCLATLQERNRAAYMRSAMRFEELFDRLFFSCELGWQKTDPNFYAAVERQLGLPGEQILFWDDSPRNVEAALSCGWHAELYHDLPSFRQIMRRYGFGL